MSCEWWDLGCQATTIYRSVTDTISDFVHDPLNAKNIIALGGTAITPGFGDKYGSIVSANAEGTKNVAVGAFTTAQTGGFNLLGQNAGVQSVLRDKRVSTATLGASEDFAGASSASGAWLSGGRGSKADEEGALRFGVKYGAAVATAGAYGALGGTATKTGAALTYSGLQSAARGDVAGVAGASLGGAGLDEFTPLTELLPGGSSPTYNLGGVKYQLPSYDTSGIGTNYPPISTGTGFSGPAQAGISPVVIAVAAVALLYIAKKRGMF